MKLKYEFVVNQVADQNVAVPVGNDLEGFNGFLKMNDIGVYIFNMLKNDVSEEEIVAAMAKDYSDATEDEIKEAVRDFTTKLKEAGLAE